jgi:hypothetical protein
VWHHMADSIWRKAWEPYHVVAGDCRRIITVTEHLQASRIPWSIGRYYARLLATHRRTTIDCVRMVKTTVVWQTILPGIWPRASL